MSEALAPAPEAEGAGESGDLSSLLSVALEQGATEARVIPAASVVTAAWVRLRCQYGCGRYGSSRCCPPHAPTPEEMRRVLDGYRRAILFRGRRLKDPTAIVLKLERQAFLVGFYKAFGLGAGPCRLCATCDLTAACQHPKHARPAMEACGIDVYATVRDNGMPIHVLTSEDDQGDYYGLLLVD